MARGDDKAATKAEHMAAPTSNAVAQLPLANGEPSTQGAKQTDVSSPGEQSGQYPGSTDPSVAQGPSTPPGPPRQVAEPGVGKFSKSVCPPFLLKVSN